ncbi:hypothetical protein Deipe_4447 (plasmid) [Deinococcus peraridilitoris DSM 19664]|uniref:Uncharacterized protein n=1 Tax=Deinococcus peraridilitoris (strain DSM 19664 / LMG 22246 / CIP 109416 / KR-200) TaxID=937777 RepID=L0A9N9_DEIPD|nr:hypothetical protein Deipe_4447 [Deinococcus peraridilitoris DSM 19664]
MSKHFFRAKVPGWPPLEVDAGWDRPQQHFYLNVTAPGPPEEEDTSTSACTTCKS